MQCLERTRMRCGPNLDRVGEGTPPTKCHAPTPIGLRVRGRGVARGRACLKARVGVWAGAAIAQGQLWSNVAQA